jgi:hypothetical protein
VNELKDFYFLDQRIEKYESFIEEKSSEKYYNKIFGDASHKFSFSTYRFHLLQAYQLGITNVGMFCVDSCFDFNVINESVFNDIISNKDSLLAAVAIYEMERDHVPQLSRTFDLLSQHYHFVPKQTKYLIPDAAARFFVFDNDVQMMGLFHLWNDLILRLFDTGDIVHYYGSRVINDEFIVGPLYNIFGINNITTGPFKVNHKIMDAIYEDWGRFEFNNEYIKNKNIDI